MNPLIQTVVGLAIGAHIVTLQPSIRADSLHAHLDKINALFTNATRSGKGYEIKHVYDVVLNGYAVEASDEMLDKIKLMAEVEDVESDLPCYTLSVQENSPWGLSRISSLVRLEPNRFDYNYTHNPSGGEGVDVYVIDSGVNVDHLDFEGRASEGVSFVPGAPEYGNFGHGTHVAGIVASKTYGVAKKAHVISVKVADELSPGFNSLVIAGINWALKTRVAGRGCVINVSYGSKRSEALNRAARDANNLGCIVVASAGNSNINACNISPASEGKVITVGATDITDTRQELSNWGSCLDMFAPGVNILSTWSTGKDSAYFLSGSSMAAPHVSGLVATLISETNYSSPHYIKRKLRSLALKGILKNVENSPNLLLHSKLRH